MDKTPRLEFSLTIEGPSLTFTKRLDQEMASRLIAAISTSDDPAAARGLHQSRQLRPRVVAMLGDKLATELSQRLRQSWLRTNTGQLAIAVEFMQSKAGITGLRAGELSQVLAQIGIRPLANPTRDCQDACRQKILACSDSRPQTYSLGPRGKEIAEQDQNPRNLLKRSAA